MNDKTNPDVEALAKTIVDPHIKTLTDKGYGIAFVLFDNKGSFTSGNVGSFNVPNAMNGLEILAENTVQQLSEHDPKGVQHYLQEKIQAIGLENHPSGNA